MGYSAHFSEFCFSLKNLVEKEIIFHEIQQLDDKFQVFKFENQNSRLSVQDTVKMIMNNFVTLRISFEITSLTSFSDFYF